MDDDPEPTRNAVILDLGSCETKEQAPNVGGLQKCSLESSDETSTNPESGDNGPFLEAQESAKKAFPGQAALDPPESNGGVLRRKELVGASQTADRPGSLKSSASLRKASRRSLQRLPGPESRRGGQQPASQPLPLSQKPSRSQSISETDAKDATWVSKRTGKIMTCRSQQTSLIWERKVLSAILHPSSEDSDRSKEGETNTEEELPSSGEMAAAEECSGQDARRGSQAREGKGLRRSSQQRESRRSSQGSRNELPLLLPQGMGIEEEICWVSQKTGKEMKNKAQQTSVIWELKTLSEILRSSSQESLCNALETDATEAEETLISSGETEVERPALQESQGSAQQPEGPPAPEGQESRRSSRQAGAKAPRRNTLQAAEQEAELEGQRAASKFDQSQQTDSEGSPGKELRDYGEQAGTPRRSKGSSVGQPPDSHRSSRAASSPRMSQDAVAPDSGPGVESAAKAPTSFESEQIKSPGEPLSTTEMPGRRGTVPLEENTWISRKTGKVVKNQEQQTDRSWLQYCAAKTKTVKKCSSQQTDESFLQSYLAGKKRRASADTLPGHAACEEGQSDTPCSTRDGGLSSTPPVSMLGLYSLKSYAVFTEAEDEPPLDEDEEAPPLRPAEEDVGDPPAGSWAPRPGEPESQWATGGGSAQAEGEGTAQQSYSVISVEDGIWMNRRTGKLLVSRSQQTSRTSLLGAWSAAARRRASGAAEAPEPLVSGVAGAGAGEEQVAGEAAPLERSRNSLQQEACPTDQPGPGSDARPGTLPPAGGESQATDDIEQLLSSRLSEATLLSLESLDAEDGSAQVYSSLDGGNWVNMQTGTLLATQGQQTEEGFAWGPAAEGQPPGDPSQPPPGGEQAEVREPREQPPQQPGGEGMDDDPVTRTPEPSPAGSGVLAGP